MYITLTDKADRHRHTTPAAAFAANDDAGLLLLELTGPDIANRAVWANIVKARTERSLTPTQATFHQAGQAVPIMVIPTTKYHKVEQPGRLILLHAGFTRWRLQLLFDGGETPNPWFLAGWQSNLPLPILPHWAGLLWAAGIKHNLVTRPDHTYGPVVIWHVNWDLARWQHLVQTLVKQRKLTEADHA